MASDDPSRPGEERGEREARDAEAAEQLERAARAAFRALAPEAPAPSVLDTIESRVGKIPRVILPSPEATDQDQGAAAPATIATQRGNYEVLSELARGGMGIIVKGRDRDLGRVVALKMLQQEHCASPEGVRRFVEEAQIGGQLEHPGVVPVYEVGVLSDGRPFFAMKLVQGRTLADLLRERRSVADDRRRFLTIFEQIAQTVAYAHARGVIHRDLKPQNVMVGAFGEVQVVDWGLAKLLRSGAAERENALDPIAIEAEHRSRAGLIMGTPAFMAPEQARGEIDRVDERADVFALGAMLCEILTGEPPFVPATQALAKARAGDVREAVMRLRSAVSDPEPIELAVRCLAADLDSRPRNATAVSELISSYLAAAEERTHRARVAAAEARVEATQERRRRRLLIVLAGSVLLGLGVSLWFLARARQERAAAEVARVESDQVTTFLSDMLASVDPTALGRDVTVLAMLDQASQQLPGKFANQQQVKARLAWTMGKAYLELGELAKAEPQLEEALRINETAFGSDSRRCLAIRSDLGALRHRQGRYAEAEQILREALAGQRRVSGIEDDQTQTTITTLIEVYLDGANTDAAAPLAVELLDVSRRQYGEHHQYTAEALQKMATVHSERSEYAEAERCLEQALAVFRETCGEKHRKTLGALSDLGIMYMRQNRPERAEPCLRQVLEGQRTLLGEQHPDFLAVMNNLAVCYQGLNQLDKAEPLMVEQLALRRKALGADDPGTLRCKHNLAVLYQQQGRNEVALQLLEEVVDAARDLLPEDRWELGVYLSKYGSCLRSLERHEEAEEALLEAWQILNEQLGEEDERSQLVVINLVRLYQAMKDTERVQEWRARLR